ncbi:MAG: hypothetical protein MUF18_06170 [Fimbriiglobus sp.]|jgi:hypothetical protein|nr:hypothetical protein [Fimbriiglobus sp.]
MIRLSTILLGIVLAATAAAAPVPKALQKKAAEWMPLLAGAKWEFVSADDNATTTDTREITSVGEKDGHTTATQRTINLTQEFRRDDVGVAVVKTSNRGESKPRYVVRHGMKEGDTWENDMGGYSEVRTVGRIERIKVPAGEFDAVPVKFQYVQQGQAFQTGAVWYAAGVGLVRIDTDGSPSEVLKAYTPGKK